MIQRFTSRFTLASALVLSLAHPSLAQDPHAYTLSGDPAGTHDPSIIKEGKTWYVFATGKAPDGGQFAVRCSDDLEHWKFCGHVFDAIPDWIHQRSPGTRDLWAPDISYVNHEYRLYYAYSLFGKNTSGIALATNKTLDPASPDFKWIDKGLVFESKAGDNYNAIDPNLVLDAGFCSPVGWSDVSCRRRCCCWRLDEGSSDRQVRGRRGLEYTIVRKCGSRLCLLHGGALPVVLLGPALFSSCQP